MYLHLGGDALISQEKIIAIIDLETATKNSETVNFLEKIKNNKKLNIISEPGKEKSLIITNDLSYISPISSTTLLKRAKYIEIQ